MNKSQRQAIQEVIEATRLHSKAINRMRSLLHHGVSLEDIEEGLEISATKLEVALKEDDIPDISINALCLTVRAMNILDSANVATVAELMEMSGVQMMKYRGAGKKTIAELSNALKKFDLDWPSDKGAFGLAAHGFEIKEEIRAALRKVSRQLDLLEK